MTPPATPALPPPSRSALPPGVAVALGVVVLVLIPSFLAYVRVWDGGGTYPHGWVILGLCLYLVWRDRGVLQRGTGGIALALVPLAGASLLWFVSMVMEVQVGHLFAIPFLLLGWGVVVYGWAGVRALAPVAATFLLAVPLWEVFTRPLQTATVLVSGAVVRLLGIEAVIQGDTITIQYGTFLVEGSCAGLGYFLTGLVVGVCYAHLFMRSWGGRVAVVALGAGLAILSNWVRVGSLVVIGEATEMQSSLMASHGNYGWVLFSISLIPFFLIAQRMERWDRKWAKAGGGTGPQDADRQGAAGEAGSAEGQAAPVGDPAGDTDAATRKTRDAALSARALLATGAAALGPLLYYGLGALPSAEMEPGSFLAREGGWAETAVTSPVTWQLEYPDPDLRRQIAWSSGDTATVFTDRLVYRDQEQGRELVNSLNRIAPDSLILRERTVGPVDARGRSVREAWVQGDQGVVLTWYWYRVAGAETASGARAKLLELVAFVTRRQQAELVTVSAPCGEDDCEPAARALLAFLQEG